MYRELPPPPDLAEPLACVWTTVAKGGRILPDGCADIVWDGARVVVAGPATIAAQGAPAPGTAVFGVRFRLGAAGAGLGLPAAELADLEVPLADLWPDGEAVDEAAATSGLAGLIGAVRGRLRGGGDPLARAAALGLARPDARVARLGAELGISERQLRRRFDAAVGYGPKTLGRILRFQRFLALAQDPGAPDLARLALDAGYADQAHLTRECRRLAGRTPAELVRLDAHPAGERVPWRG